MRLVVCFALMLGGGCSLVFQDRMPPGSMVGTVSDTTIDGRTMHVIREPTCSGSMVSPMFDYGFLAAELGLAAYGAMQRDVDRQNVIIGTSLFVGLVQFASAQTGYERAAQCRRARRAVTERK